ncbi:MAG: pancreas/duodenum homeobox protein 1 [Desulfobacterales bacterium]
MQQSALDNLFSEAQLKRIFPEHLTDRFFEVLLGDAEDGAYDIRLVFDGCNEGELNFAFHLIERPGKCLVCSLTYGLPEVFRRHPVIDLEGVVAAIGKCLNGSARFSGWRLGKTREIARGLHAIPLKIELEATSR